MQISFHRLVIYAAMWSLSLITSIENPYGVVAVVKPNSVNLQPCYQTVSAVINSLMSIHLFLQKHLVYITVAHKPTSLGL